MTLNPGGTGPMTVLALMQNLIDAARYQLGLRTRALLRLISQSIRRLDVASGFALSLRRHCPS